MLCVGFILSTLKSCWLLLLLLLARLTSPESPLIVVVHVIHQMLTSAHTHTERRRESGVDVRVCVKISYASRNSFARVPFWPKFWPQLPQLPDERERESPVKSTAFDKLTCVANCVCMWAICVRPPLCIYGYVCVWECESVVRFVYDL